MTKEQLTAILAGHKAWLAGSEKQRADLTGAYLRGADLSGANLTDADLSGADLSGANLTDAYLTGANLTGAYLTGAQIKGKTVVRLPRRVTLADGNEFFLWHCEDLLLNNSDASDELTRATAGALGRDNNT